MFKRRSSSKMLLTILVNVGHIYNPEEDDGEVFTLELDSSCEEGFGSLEERFGSWEEFLRYICVVYSRIYQDVPITAVLKSCV